MKIGVVSTVYGSPWAGSEELWYQTSLACLKQNHEVMASVFEVFESCSQHDNFKNHGGKIVFRKRFKNGSIHILKHKYVSSFGKLFAWKPDLILLSLGNLSDVVLYPDLGRHLEANPRTKLILICLFNSDNTIYNPVSRKIIQKFCKRTHHFIFVSGHNYKLAERQLAMKFDNVSVFSSPVSYLDSYTSLPWPADDSVLRMACVARLDIATKGHDILLASLANDIWRNRNWHLSIYGKGSDEEYIRSLVKLYALENYVSFEGFLPNTRDIWKNHHMMVMASRAEGLSLAVLEAMICGRVCVVSDVGGHGEVIRDSYSGFLSEGPQPKYFQAALERAWGMRDQLPEIGKHAVEAASKVFEENPVAILFGIINKV